MMSMLSGSRESTKELQDAGYDSPSSFDRMISTASFERRISTASFERRISTSSFDRTSRSPSPSRPLSPLARTSWSSHSPPRVSKEVAKGTWEEALDGGVARQRTSKDLSRVSLALETAGGDVKEPDRRVSKGILVAASGGVRQLTKEKRKISFDHGQEAAQDSIPDGPLRAAGRVSTLEAEPPGFASA